MTEPSDSSRGRDAIADGDGSRQPTETVAVHVQRFATGYNVVRIGGNVSGDQGDRRCFALSPKNSSGHRRTWPRGQPGRWSRRGWLFVDFTKCRSAFMAGDLQHYVPHMYVTWRGSATTR